MPRKPSAPAGRTGRTAAGNTRDVKVERVGPVTIYKCGGTYSLYYREGGTTRRRRVDGNLAAARATAHKVGDALAEDRVRAVADTAKQGVNGRTTGWPRLAELLGAGGDVLVSRVREWLGVREPAPVGSVGSVGNPVPRPLPPYQPFSTHTLTPVVRAYVEATAAAMGCDPAYSALPAPRNPFGRDRGIARRVAQAGLARAALRLGGAGGELGGREKPPVPRRGGHR